MTLENAVGFLPSLKARYVNLSQILTKLVLIVCGVSAFQDMY